MIVHNLGFNPFMKDSKSLETNSNIQPDLTVSIIENVKPQIPIKNENIYVNNSLPAINLNSLLLPLEKIEVKWSTDYNIVELTTVIISYIKKSRERSVELEKAISIIKKFDISTLTTDEISNLRTKLELMENKLNSIKQFSVMDFKSDVNPILKEYKELTVSAPKIFGQEVIVDVAKKSRQTELVEEYLKVAKKYCPLTAVREFNGASFCKSCNSSLMTQNGQYICNECFTVQKKSDIIVEALNFEDFNIKKSSSDKTDGYRDVVMQWQGTYPINIPDKVLKSIKSAIAEYKIFNINTMSKVDLLKIMKELGLSSWYKHINKIYVILTGKQTQDISMYLDNVLKRGELFGRIYDEIKPDSRSNFIHGLYLFWQFLMNEGCRPNMDDFCLLKGRDCEIANIDILQKGFAKLRQSNPEFEWKIYQIP